MQLPDHTGTQRTVRLAATRNCVLNCANFYQRRPPHRTSVAPASKTTVRYSLQQAPLSIPPRPPRSSAQVTMIKLSNQTHPRD
jgi:hypothetical protein